MIQERLNYQPINDLLRLTWPNDLRFSVIALNTWLLGMPHHIQYIDKTFECLLKKITCRALKPTRSQVGVTCIHRQKKWND